MIQVKKIIWEKTDGRDGSKITTDKYHTRTLFNIIISHRKYIDIHTYNIIMNEYRYQLHKQF